MAQITIRLRYNLQTGKKDLLIDYHADEDALPMEHEQEHREIVAQLIGRGIVGADEVGDVVVRRQSPQSIPPLSAGVDAPLAAPVAEEQG